MHDPFDMPSDRSTPLLPTEWVNQHAFEHDPVRIGADRGRTGVSMAAAPDPTLLAWSEGIAGL